MTVLPNATFAAFPIADGFDMHGDFGDGWWIVVLIGMFVFWGLIFGAVVWLVREIAGSRSAHAGLETPSAMLDRRFASGEISADEYRERKAVLDGESQNPTAPRS